MPFYYATYSFHELLAIRPAPKETKPRIECNSSGLLEAAVVEAPTIEAADFIARVVGERQKQKWLQRLPSS